MENIFNEQILSLNTYIMFKLAEITAELTPELKKRNRNPISLSMGAPTANPPQFVIDKLKEALDEDGIHTYSTPRGEKYYREAISLRMKNRFNVEVNPDTEIFSLIGSKEGIANLIRFITTPKAEEFEKDIILVPNPCYASYLEFIKCSGAKGYSLPLTKENNYQPDLEEIRENLINDGYNPKNIKALIINYPNNPLGISASREYVQSCVDFCKKYKIILMSDAAYCDMYFDEKEKPFSVLELNGAKDVAIEFFSFSKPYALTGWRLGWVCGNKEIVQRFGKGKSTIDNGIFKGMQKACSQILNSKDGDEYIAQGNKGFARKQSIMVKGLEELGWDISAESVPHTTFYLWLPIPPRYNSAFEFCEDVLHKSGVVLVPGNAFGDCGEGFFRLSYVCSDEKLQEVIERFKADGFYFNK
ncbi:MAG: aminotransferase class I/II-fold pyridoxal phosphate-dependent enzyme [Candidatus Gastranaerophilales bacterium]